MANEQNLIRPEDRTPSERKEAASRAGKASGVARRKKKETRELLRELLTLPLYGDRPLDELAGTLSTRGKNFTTREALLLAQLQKALQGDLASLQYIIRLSGDEPRPADTQQPEGEHGSAFIAALEAGAGEAFASDGSEGDDEQAT